ncbi:MAG: hypothetical protein HOW97_03020 [Catenulispora sp.]|nr:hypothetical protein [Catenulispora sp.]
MDTDTEPQPDPVSDPNIATIVDMLLDDTSLACLSVPAALAAETATLLRSTGIQPVAASQVADLLERSLLGDLCLLNLHHCEAVELLLGDITDTALPTAVRAGQIASLFGSRRRAAP